MKKLFLSLTVFALISCGEKTDRELIRDKFMNYVQTDFDNPREFKEITSIETLDTLNNQFVLETINGFEQISSILTSWQQERLIEFKQKFIEDKTFIVEYELKVRVEKNGRKKIEKYYAIDNGYDINIQGHRLQTDETPELYQDYYKFASDIIN